MSRTFPFEVSKYQLSRTTGQHSIAIAHPILDERGGEGAVEVAQLLAHRLQEHGHALDLDVADTLPPVDADRDRVAQVLTNLLSNAIKYTPPSGRVAIRARAQGD